MDRQTLKPAVLADDAGATTAMIVGVFAALMLLLAAALSLLQVHVSASRAAVAADLAALAAADAARGLMIADPCGLAATTVTEHGANLTGCEITAPGVAHIQVELTTPMGFMTRAQARAGPQLP